jgi:ABC-2 type transport system ATP-binding protein
MIEIKRLTKRFSDILAVNGLDIIVQQGEIYGFIGPNGAGKTTTINMMGGILKPTSGTVEICGIPMGTHPEKAKRKIGFIPDTPFIYEKLTGVEFLRFTADMYEVNEDIFKKKSEELLELFLLTSWSDDLIESYSHGMKQRLVMAASLLHAPEVIIVDEPMVGLDPMAIKMVKDLFQNLAKQGVTIFMSTHTLKVAEEMCDRIGVIHKGFLVATGTVEDLTRNIDASESDLEQVFIRLTEE